MTARHISNLVVYHHSQYFAIMATSGYPAWIRTNPSVLYSLDLFGSIIPGWNVSCRWLFLSNNWDLPLPGLIAGEQVKFSWFFLVLPECVARVPVSLWGSGGWGCVRSTSPNRPQPSATVRNRSQPFATVRNRSQPFARSPYGRAYGLWQVRRRGHFWRFQTSRCFVSRGRRGTS